MCLLLPLFVNVNFSGVRLNELPTTIWHLVLYSLSFSSYLFLSLSLPPYTVYVTILCKLKNILFFSVRDSFSSFVRAFVRFIARSTSSSIRHQASVVSEIEKENLYDRLRPAPRHIRTYSWKILWMDCVCARHKRQKAPKAKKWRRAKPSRG